MKKSNSLIIVFIGSFLLFGIQPMLGGTLLPSFGGSAAVWTVCLASFQTLLFIGYLYAHLISRKSLKTQRTAHMILLTVAAAWTMGFAMLQPHLKGAINTGYVPALKVLFCVIFIVGLPYILLSAGSTLVQVWVSKTCSGSNDGVYKLYAVSNMGSFSGLFAYPLLFEPFVSLRMQWLGFAVLLGLYTVLIARQGPRQAVVDLDDDRSIVEEVRGSHPKNMALWFFLPACSVFLLNALTAHITLDLMPLPLLWAVLLALFLLSYVVGFSGFRSNWFLLLPFVAAGFSILSSLMGHRFDDVGAIWDFIATLGLCFFGPLFLHHWLYELRPATKHLTLYYLGNAGGGALGGLFASILAPHMFKTVAEYPTALGLLGIALVAYALAHLPHQKLLASGVLGASIATFLAVGFVFVWVPQKNTLRPVVYRDRGFFGTLSVTEQRARIGNEDGFIRKFYHGNTMHGIQATMPSMRRMATAYYTPDAGGLAVLQHPKYKRGEPMRVAIVGLGMGTMATYGRTNDFYRGYEISPEVINIATNPALFSFLSDSPATIDLVLGDARKSLEAERAANEPRYDVICLDTFTGDNIPRHHSTQEAFQLYFDRLEPDGILAVNISNRFMDLHPLIRSVGTTFNCKFFAMRESENMSKLRASSDWAYFTRSIPEDFEFPLDASFPDLRQVRQFKLPTDEKGSFISLIRWPWNK